MTLNLDIQSVTGAMAVKQLAPVGCMVGGNYGRAATKVRRCPPEGVAGLSKLRGFP